MKAKMLLNLDTTPDIKVSGTSKDYHEFLNKRLKYLHKFLQNFKSKRIAMINKDRVFFQYDSTDLVYIIFPLTSQLHTAARKVMIKYVGPVVIYKNYRPTQLFTHDIRWKNSKRSIQTWKVKTSHIKN